MAAAGLRVGDVVTKVGTPRIAAEALMTTVRSLAPGSTADVTYVRDGETRTVTVTLGSVTEQA